MRILLHSVILLVSTGCNTLVGVDEGNPRPAAPGGPSSPPPSGCTSNAQCLEQTGEFDPSACIQGTCVKLLTPDCPLLLPQTEGRWLDNLRSSGPEPVIFGAFLHVPTDSLYGIGSHNYDLALTEFTRTVGGLPTASGKRRPVLAVVCRNVYREPEKFDAAIDHLIEQVQVPGMVAQLETAALVHAFQRSGDARHVFFMSPASAEKPLIDLDDAGLVWNALAGGEAVARVYPAVVDLTIEHLRNTGDLDDDEQVRIALVRADNIVNLSETATAVTELIEFNGGTADENAPEHFRSFSITSPVLGDPESDYGLVLEKLVEFAPHIIISAAADEFPNSFIPTLEAANLEPRPMYVLSPWNQSDGTVIDVARSFQDVSLRTRMIGVNWAGASDQTLYNSYQARFDAAYPALAGTLGFENYYDAAYYLLYAAVAAGPRYPLIGADLAFAMPSLLAGRVEYDVGPDDLPQAYQALQTPNTSITLNATMGPPDFDAQTGARSTPGTVWCLDEVFAKRTDVLRLDDEGQLAGDFPCFAFP